MGWNRANVFARNAAQVMGGAGEGGKTMPLGQIGLRSGTSVIFDPLA